MKPLFLADYCCIPLSLSDGGAASKVGEGVKGGRGADALPLVEVMGVLMLMETLMEIEICE